MSISSCFTTTRQVTEPVGLEGGEEAGGNDLLDLEIEDHPAQFHISMDLTKETI